MAIGFNDGTTQFIPDKGLDKVNKPKVYLAQFGDGYEQRTPVGINSIGRTYNVSFKNRTKADIDDIEAFLDSKTGTEAFDFTIPDTNEIGEELTVKVVCEDYTTVFEYDEYYTLRATFRRVFEP